MKYYKDKSSLYLLLLLVFPMGLYFFSDDRRLFMYFLFLFIPLVAFSSRSYLIRDKTLKTPTKYININSILKIERRKFNIKSKYFSFDKIVLTFDENETVKISPKEEQDFIKHLLSINPNIEVKI